ncbi:MAG: hypothetical protein H6828_04365 [Planctomycetes bacterium]|nr:hypothetical protein [Planctomycetota bacterium]
MHTSQKTRLAILPGQAALVGIALALAGCSGGGSSSADGGAMYVESCSLGCGNGIGGQQVNCSIVNVGQNSEITLLFSAPIDLTTVTSGSFQVINTNTGTVPVGTYALDPANPRRLIFRPGIDFDALGNPDYAFDADATYQILLPGQGQGDSGPFIRSTSGKANQSRMQCSIRTSEGLIDPVPGNPTAQVFVQKSDGMGGTIEVIANGATEVDLDSTVKVVFNDIMNPATIANLSTGESSSIQVKIDPDGNIGNPNDQVGLAGTWTVDVDFTLLTTTAIFTPSGGFPSAGGDALHPRLTLVNLPSQLLDLKGNGLANPGQHVFATKVQAFPEIKLPKDGGEDFADSSNEDVLASGADWGAGRLRWGIGGGAGRLGPLLVRAGTEVVLNTDSQVFPLDGHVRSILDNSEPGVDYDPLDPLTWPTITITDGTFEFSSVDIEPNGRLVLTGSNPGRIFARGQVVHNGVIDLSGETPAAHASNSGGMDPDNIDPNDSHPLAYDTRFGGAGGVGGPGAGDGGQGADRHNTFGAANPLPTTAGGMIFPTGETPVNDGRPGEGVGGSTATGGVGGLRYPNMLPMHWELGNVNYGDAEISIMPPDLATTVHTCGIGMVAGPGSGGAYALPGGVGQPASPFTSVNPGLKSNVPSATPGGDNSSLNLEAPGTEIGLFLVRHLEYVLGYLRGGAGGGGGGTSVYGSKNNNNTSANNCATTTAHLFPFFDHSAAGGGGGGGALQLTAGRKISMGGRIDCTGGDGGSALEPNAPLTSNCLDQGQLPGIPADCEKFAAPGGGGSGGAVRLQSIQIVLGGQANQLDVTGGDGGFGAGGSVGGAGSPGLVRLEHSDFVNAATSAAQYTPFIAPKDPSFDTPYTSASIASFGAWGNPQFRPGSFCGAQSCWMKPVGSFFELAFSEDDAGSPNDPAAKGWNMDVLYNTGSGVKAFPYRGLSSDPDFPNMGGLDFEHFLGQTLNHDEVSPNAGSFFVVRFQGARATGELADPCDVDLQSAAEIEIGSLTPWVRSPEDLNQFSPKPNMVRFAVIFEPRLVNQGAIQANITGVTNLEVKVQPN